MKLGTTTKARALLAVTAAGATALLASAPVAAGAAPEPRTVANPVRAKPAGNSIGELAFRTAFDDARAFAVATPSPLRLSAGYYRIETCVSAKAAAVAPVAHCEQAEVHPNVLTGLGSVAAPAAALTIGRPAAGQPPATIAGRVLVYVREPAGTYALYASSWPAGGLPSAGIAVPAFGALDTGPVLGPQGPAAPGYEAGGVNTGSQDSICAQNVLPGSPPLDGSTTALGALPFDYEVDEPAGGTPRGIMLIVHGGAWSIVGRTSMSGMRPDIERWRARGWRTVNTTYRACGASIADLVTLFDRVRGTYGQALPICAFGRSAGGHLSLLLAALRPQLACVTSIAGPSDLVAIAGQSTPADPAGALRTANFATAAFGADRLALVSPARMAVNARVLYGIGIGDILVPWEQATGFAAAQRRRDPAAYVDTMHVEAGDVPFEHADVSRRGLDAFFAHEQTLVAPLLVGSVTAPAVAHLKPTRSRGLRARYTCTRRCTVTARLELGASAARRLGLARVVGRGSASRASRGAGTLTVRLTRTARSKLGPVSAQLVSVVEVGKTRRRQRADIVLRR